MSAPLFDRSSEYDAMLDRGLRLWGEEKDYFIAGRPAGYFALFENNPWNPGARLVMRRIPFDRDAIMLSPRHAARMLILSGRRRRHLLK